MPRIRMLFAAMLLALMTPCSAHEEVAQEMRKAATAWIASLPQDLREQATFDLGSEERLNWHFVPRGRKGVPLGSQQPESLKHVHHLLQIALSERGYLQATTIINLEILLREIEQSRGPTRDPALYYLTVFGAPATNATWGWRFEGHHLSLNFLIVDGREVTIAPNFFGSNPAKVMQGPRQGLRLLKDEEDLGRELARSLDPEQKAIAVFSDRAPADIITGNSRQARRLDPGLTFEKMNQAQRALLTRLVETYLRRYRSALAESDLERIQRSGWPNVSFSWAGSVEPGQGHYYRVQGPTFLLEYDNTQNRANHIHTVWRDYEHDFGLDLLQEHYRSSTHPDH